MMELMQFEKEYRVHVYETGPDGKLNLCIHFSITCRILLLTMLSDLVSAEMT